MRVRPIAFSDLKSTGYGAPETLTDAREPLSAVWAYINANASGTGSVRDWHPLAARVGRRADVLFDEIGRELSQDGVLVHRFPGFRGNAAGNLRTLNSR